MSYYIKVIYPPADDLQVSEKHYIHFTKKSKRYAERFSACAGFLVYATGRTEDGMKLFARGEPLLPWPKDVWDEDPREVDGVRYPIGVEVRIDKRVDLDRGVSRATILKLCPRLKNNTFQSHGGLVELLPDEFEALSAELDRC